MGFLLHGHNFVDYFALFLQAWRTHSITLTVGAQVKPFGQWNLLTYSISVLGYGRLGTRCRQQQQLIRHPAGETRTLARSAIESKCRRIRPAAAGICRVSVPRVRQIRLQDKDTTLQLCAALEPGGAGHGVSGHRLVPDAGQGLVCAARPAAGLPDAARSWPESGATGRIEHGVCARAVATLVARPAVDLRAHLATSERQECAHREALRVSLVLRPPRRPVLHDESPHTRLER